MNAKQRRMVGHASIIMLIALTAGFGLTAALLNGFEFIPGIITQFAIFGEADAWARAHVGGMLNAIMIIAVAAAIAQMKVPDALTNKLFWMFVGTGYANTIFYWGALLAPNRAISFADNPHGESNIFSIIGLLPALIFAIVVMIGFYMIMREAFASAKEMS